ncbi:uncharacterized protein LOC128654503 [Bombina bombina]|uniref:uncharacterized protein LOC128654503 n=1 Tax=Bombina bombina TaxID=8345 RepID=UPI00235A81B2|nr:uncharacterized protein LOC128654503 [Bombina bombina]
MLKTNCIKSGEIYSCFPCLTRCNQKHIPLQRETNMKSETHWRKKHSQSPASSILSSAKHDAECQSCKMAEENCPILDLQKCLQVLHHIKPISKQPFNLLRADLILKSEIADLCKEPLYLESIEKSFQDVDFGFVTAGKCFEKTILCQTDHNVVTKQRTGRKNVQFRRLAPTFQHPRILLESQTNSKKCGFVYKENLNTKYKMGDPKIALEKEFKVATRIKDKVEMFPPMRSAGSIPHLDTCNKMFSKYEETCDVLECGQKNTDDESLVEHSPQLFYYNNPDGTNTQRSQVSPCKTSFTMDLHLPLEFALQLVDLFGPLGLQIDELLSEDYTVSLDWDLSMRIHQQWKQSLKLVSESLHQSPSTSKGSLINQSLTQT